MDRDFKGVWIPREIYLSKDLSWSEKILLVEIDSLDNDGGCYAGNDYFADFLGLGETRISKMISKLIELGYIKKVSFNGRQRILKCNIKYCKADLNKSTRQDDTKVQGSIEEKYNSIKPETQDAPRVKKSKKTSNNINNNTFNNTFNKYIEDYTKNDELKKAIIGFIDMRKIIRKPLTANALGLILKKLSKLANNDNTKIEILDQSIMNSWQGIFELKEGGTNGKYSGNNQSNKQSEEGTGGMSEESKRLYELAKSRGHLDNLKDDLDIDF